MPAVKDLRFHTALGFSFFTTYHEIVTYLTPVISLVLPSGSLNLPTKFKSTALVTGVISDSRADVETIKVFQVVNRIVCRIHFAVDLYGEKWIELGG